MGKKILGILAGLLLIPVVCLAEPFAICDPQAGVTAYDLEVDGIVEVIDIPAQPDGSLLYDVAAYAGTGERSFKIRAKNLWGVSEWTDPLSEDTSGAVIPAGFGFGGSE